MEKKVYMRVDNSEAVHTLSALINMCEEFATREEVIDAFSTCWMMMENGFRHSNAEIGETGKWLEFIAPKEWAVKR